jgi:hypothetical protein
VCDVPSTVHLQGHHRGATNRRDSDDCRAFIDAKVLLPHVATRIDQSNLSSAFRVLTRLKSRLTAIAGVASQRKIVESIGADVRLREDMLHLKQSVTVDQVLAISMQDARRQGAGMQADAAGVLVWGGVEAPAVSSSSSRVFPSPSIPP